MRGMGHISGVQMHLSSEHSRGVRDLLLLRPFRRIRTIFEDARVLMER
jgi:hypothetical protein